MAASSLVWASEETLVLRERNLTRARARSTTSASDNSRLLSKTIRTSVTIIRRTRCLSLIDFKEINDQFSHLTKCLCFWSTGTRDRFRVRVADQSIKPGV